MILDLQQNTPEWLSFRKFKIGASDAPVIMGVSPWTTPLQLWERKLDLVPEKQKTYSMQRGSDLENDALNCFNAIMGLSLQPKVVLCRCYDWAIASLDGFDGDKIAVEIKCPGFEDHQKAINGIIPDKYYPQLQHQMLVAGLGSMWYYSFDGCAGVALKVSMDEEYQNTLLGKEKEFYKCMTDFIPPIMTERDYQIKNDQEFLEACEQYKLVKKELKLLEQFEQELRQKLVKASCGQNTIGGGLKISKSIRRGLVDYKIIPELESINLDMFRSDPVVSWRITEATE